jgi:hypothetical protein
MPLRTATAFLGLGAIEPVQLPAIAGMPPDDPVLKQVDDDICWYDRNAKRTMHAHRRYRGAQIIAAALLPVSQVFFAGLVAREMTAVLGAVILILQGFDAMHQYEEHYAAWRATAQALFRERFMFSVHSGPYANPPAGYDPRRLLAERCDAITAAENQQWAQTLGTGQNPQQ